jgi:selenoprotein W-related protein
VSLADELLKTYELAFSVLELVPASGGVFEVSLDGELLFSKKAQGRHAYAHEVFDLVKARLGDPPELED